MSNYLIHSRYVRTNDVFNAEIEALKASGASESDIALAKAKMEGEDEKLAIIIQIERGEYTGEVSDEIREILNSRKSSVVKMAFSRGGVAGDA